MRFPLTVSLRPARGVLAPVLVAHLAAGLALFHSPALQPIFTPAPSGAISVLPGLVALLVIVLSAAHGWRAESRKRGVELALGDDGVLSRYRGGERQDYRVLGSSVDSAWVLWLHLEAAGSEDRQGRVGSDRAAIMLVPTNLPPGQWRLLRIWLRHKAAAAA